MAICGNCKSEGVNVAHVRQCYGVDEQKARDRGIVMEETLPNWPTEEQLKEADELDSETVRYLDERAKKGYPSEDNDWDFAPKPEGKQKTASIYEGFYKVYENENDATFDIYQVVTSQRGHLYAKLLNKEDNGFEYESGAMMKLTDNPLASRLTIEEAAHYGHTEGRCVCCQRKLTNPESVAAGIGPICASRWF